jgi:hypothetical protein
MLVSSLVRRVAQAGGNAMVLARGDASAGAVLLVCTERGQFTSIQERILDMSGAYAWQPVGPDKTQDAEKIDNYLSRRRANDGDIWIIELDIANAERFAAETIRID